jgi:hypothetical protein
MKASFLTGPLLIIVPLAFNITFFLLQKAFAYPDILRQPTETILRKFKQGGPPLRPRLATEFPAYVTGIMGMFGGVPSAVNLGALPTLWNISGPMYILGPLLFGFATFRARVFFRWAGALLVLGAALMFFKFCLQQASCRFQWLGEGNNPK